MKTLLLALMMLMSISGHTQNPEAVKTYQDIKQTLGMVPTFLKDYNPDAITGAWMDFKGVQLNTATAIPGKYKELIGLAVAAQIPCQYCVYFHTQAALLNQAKPQELREALAMAAITRRWSTFLSGTQYDEAQFRTEVDKMLNFAMNKKNIQAEEAKPTPILTPADAYKDLEMTMGLVPAFVRNYPASGIVGAWQEFKATEMNPNTAIPAKYKDLIALAVASQIPSPHSIYFNTKSAMMNGATAAEVNEAIAMAGITREWSTVLNGQGQEESKFKGEVDQVIKNLKAGMKKNVSLR